MWSATLCPVWTGTRTVVAATSSPGISRILRTSAWIFFSSPVQPVSSSTSICGTTLSAIRPWNGESVGRVTVLAAALRLECVEALATRPADGLVGGQIDRLQAGQVADRRERDHRRGGRAVRVGDQVAAVAIAGGMRVGLGDDERNAFGQAEGARVVDHQRDR